MLAAELLHAARALRAADRSTTRCTSRRWSTSARTSSSTPSAASCARAASASATRSRRPASWSIVNRGDHSEIATRSPAPCSTTPTRATSIDICPVGALTDRDFRFTSPRLVLWTAPSRSARAARRGCNIEVHTNTRRLHQSKGRRVARLKPRFNADVNHWWMCDEGRYGFHDLDAPTRLLVPQRRTAAGLERLGGPRWWRRSPAGCGGPTPAGWASWSRRTCRTRTSGSPGACSSRRSAAGLSTCGCPGGSPATGRLPHPGGQEPEHPRRRAARADRVRPGRRRSRPGSGPGRAPVRPVGLRARPLRLALARGGGPGGAGAGGVP